MYERYLLKNIHLKDVNVKVCGMRSYEPGQVNDRRFVQHSILRYVTQGKGWMEINGRRFATEQGDLMVVRPNCFYQCIADGEDPFSYIWVTLDCGESMAALLKEPVVHMPWAQSIFSRIIACASAPAAEWMVSAQVFEFFVQLAAQQVPSTTPQEDYVSRAVHYIQTNYSDSILVADLAADLGLSRNYFCRIFKQQTGLSPQEYLVSYRLERAAALLTEQGLSQKEAAFQVGYPDVYGFSRMFKRKFGVAPGAYVRMQK